LDEKVGDLSDESDNDCDSTKDGTGSGTPPNNEDDAKDDNNSIMIDNSK
jgi:hypothetical protein